MPAFKSWPPAKGFITEMPHAVALAIAVERGALFHLADAVFALLIVVGGVDAEHEQVDLSAGEQAAGDAGSCEEKPMWRTLPSALRLRR